MTNATSHPYPVLLTAGTVGCMNTEMNRRHDTTAAARPLVGLLPAEEIALLERRATWQDLPAGTEIMQRGTSAGGLVLVLEGAVKIERGAQEPITVTAAPGAPVVLGELTFLAKRLFRTATVTTTSDVRLLKLPSRTYQRVREKLPALTRFVNNVAAERLAHLDQESLEERTERYRTYLSYLEAVKRVQEPRG